MRGDGDADVPLYEYSCSSGGRFTLFRTIAERDAPAVCAASGVAWRVPSVPTIHWAPGVHPVTGTSWHDLYDESPRELAHKKGVERYDPGMPHKPASTPAPMRRYIPDRSEAEGASERLKLNPVEGEGPYIS